MLSSKLIFLTFLVLVSASNLSYSQYHFSVQCNECISEFQNNTVLNPFPAGLLKLSIIVNVSSVEGYEGSGFISAFFTPQYRSSDVGYTLNMLSNVTDFINGNTTLSCSGDVPYSYGCVNAYGCSVSSYQCNDKGYSNNPFPYNSQCTFGSSIISDQVLELNKTTQVNINCNRNNILQKQLTENYLPTSGVQLYNQTINLIRSFDIFRASYLIDTMNYPELYLNFYTRLNYNNKLIYNVYVKTDYAIKYESAETVEGIRFL